LRTRKLKKVRIDEPCKALPRPENGVGIHLKKNRLGKKHTHSQRAEQTIQRIRTAHFERKQLGKQSFRDKRSSKKTGEYGERKVENLKILGNRSRYVQGGVAAAKKEGDTLLWEREERSIGAPYLLGGQQLERSRGYYQIL